MCKVPQNTNADELAVCVVIPNRDYSSFLHAAIDSVAMQSHATLDLIIYDDGSRDESVALAQIALTSHQDRFRKALLIADPVNRGKLHALNVCLPMIKAPIMCVLDADDWLAPQFVTEAVQLLMDAHRNNPDVAFVYTDCHLVDVRGDYIARGSSRSFDASALDHSSYIPDCAPVLTERIQAILPLDETVRVATKHHKWKRLTRNGNIGIHHPKPLFSYRMHQENLSGIGVRIAEDIQSGARKEAILEKYWAMSSTTIRAE